MIHVLLLLWLATKTMLTIRLLGSIYSLAHIDSPPKHYDTTIQTTTTQQCRAPSTFEGNELSTDVHCDLFSVQFHGLLYAVVQWTLL